MEESEATYVVLAGMQWFMRWAEGRPCMTNDRGLAKKMSRGEAVRVAELLARDGGWGADILRVGKGR